MQPNDISRVVQRLFWTQQRTLLPAIPASAYLLGLLLGLDEKEILRSSLIIVPALVAVLGMGGPYLAIRAAAREALQPLTTDAPGARLERILKLPRAIELRLLVCYVAAVVIFVGSLSLSHGGTLAPVLPGVAAFGLISLTLFVRQKVAMDRTLKPMALAEFYRNPALRIEGSGLLWTRQAWYLPYAFAVSFLSALMAIGIVITTKARLIAALIDHTLREREGAELATELSGRVMAMASESILPLALLSAFFLGLAGLSAWQLSKQQEEGAKAVQASIQALASGQPKLPDWVATDEMGDLSFATASAFEKLRELAITLKEAAQSLANSANGLGRTTEQQNQMVTRQATAIQETQVTAQEIKQTSTLASQKAEQVLQQTDRADEFIRSGEEVLGQSLDGLEHIRDQVETIAGGIRDLDERARQIGTITSTMKDLADQSNMLALNASIEAVRSGEQGKGFVVVAREIRSLADQSIKATERVREILSDVGQAIQKSVALSEKGGQRIDASLAQARASGENMRQLSGIIRSNGESVRQISAAVSQQNAGVTLIFQAINELSQMTDETLGQLRETEGAKEEVSRVAAVVKSFMSLQGWSDGDDLEPPEAPPRPPQRTAPSGGAVSRPVPAAPES
ncbi:MAG TPA: methyl-accepting chemotaxis protein [Myxococcaceae bacterium]|nr:methyl-accepting chemotaxis protein [Myxococcaceae bacterium]